MPPYLAVGTVGTRKDDKKTLLLNLKAKMQKLSRGRNELLKLHKQCQDRKMEKIMLNHWLLCDDMRACYNVVSQ